MKDRPEIKRFGDTGLLLNWKSVIDDKIHAEVLAWDRFISSHFANKIVETVPAYSSLAVYLKETTIIPRFIEDLKEVSPAEEDWKVETKSNIIIIPVCYKGDLSPDLKHVAKHCSLTMPEVVRLHTEPVYKVFFIGFLPGFPYLGGMNPALNTPRKHEPRQWIERGSVGIGGAQTGVYPWYSPGGWNVIGRTPLSFFDVNSEKKSLLEAGDRIRFKAVSKREFNHIQKDVDKGTYQLEKERIK